MVRSADSERWREAAAIRDEWLEWALCSLPADRAAAEAAISELYRLVGHAPPEFVWVGSPAEALSLVPPWPPLHLINSAPRRDGQPVAGRLAALVYETRFALDAQISPQADLAANVGWRGLPTRRISDDPVFREVSEPLRTVVRDGIVSPLRAEAGAPRPDLAWRGQHDAYWVAHYDAWLRIGDVSCLPGERLPFDLFAVLARSCGWWWPLDGRCVVAERTSVVRVEKAPGGGSAVRPHAEDGPALAFPDGWGLHSWHGTRVPAWVVNGPTGELISREANVEVRRCAIERIGWDAYLEQVAPLLLAKASDPGNPGCELHLYDQPGDLPRLLVVVSGSVERDGTRRRYGLSVPRHHDDPLTAAAWTCGLSAECHSRLVTD
ncbi:DUF6745 domain-containing protein [Actinocorallia populi]|uniref:DUF6745 domain-containing protein n=1 Tax=Actinocorallia populi TaxID=2079200 RepID=UPI000D089908|nr:hypothetical protein [Actinocorallia populi]